MSEEKVRVMADALRNLVNEIRAYSSPECDDEGAPGAAELKAADLALALVECPTCKGRKYTDLSESAKCPSCKGSGLSSSVIQYVKPKEESK